MSSDPCQTAPFTARFPESSSDHQPASMVSGQEVLALAQVSDVMTTCSEQMMFQLNVVELKMCLRVCVCICTHTYNIIWSFILLYTHAIQCSVHLTYKIFVRDNSATCWSAVPIKPRTKVIKHFILRGKLSHCKKICDYSRMNY